MFNCTLARAVLMQQQQQHINTVHTNFAYTETIWFGRWRCTQCSTCSKQGTSVDDCWRGGVCN